MWVTVVSHVLPSSRFYSDSGWDNELRQFCLDHSILYQSFWTLSANPDLLGHRVTREIAEKYGITQAQVRTEDGLDVCDNIFYYCYTIGALQVPD